MERRNLLKFSIAGGLASTGLRAQQAGAMGGMPARPAALPPGQPVAQKPTDPEPHVNDIEKYPRCNYCGMDRMQFHHSRMLIDYINDAADPLCSIRCAASSLILKLGRGPKAIWVGDNASPAEIKPLVLVENATFLVGSRLPGVMTKRSKVAFGTPEAAKAAQAANGGDLTDFDGALILAYTDVADGIKSNRSIIVERLKRQKQEQKQDK